MSKVDAQRALRDARFAAYQARQASGTTPAPTTNPRKATSRPAKAEPATSSPATERDGAGPVCGHRSISNKSCTRPAGHPEKSHRYG